MKALDKMTQVEEKLWENAGLFHTSQSESPQPKGGLGWASGVSRLTTLAFSGPQPGGAKTGEAIVAKAATGRHRGWIRGTVYKRKRVGLKNCF